MKKIIIGCSIIILAILVVFATVDFKKLGSGKRDSAIAEICDKSHMVDPEIKVASEFVYSKFLELGFEWNVDIRDCIGLEFSDSITKYATFSTNNGDPTIFINSSLKGQSNIILSALLSHEMVHAFQYFNNQLDLKYPKCIDNEVEAFMYQLYFIHGLSEDQQLELYNGPEDFTNQFRSMVGNIRPIINACEKNDECINKNVKSKVREVVMSNPNYQKQCDF